MNPEKKKYSRYVYLVSSVAAVGGFLFGYDLQIISGAVLYLRSYFELTTGQEAFCMASALIGCLFGPLIGGYIADSRMGRKWSLMLAAGLFLVSAIGTALPQSLFAFNVYRIIGGVGVGLASIISPMYIAEISPPAIRGRLVSINQLMIVVGSFLAALVSWQMAKHLPQVSSWRWMFASECVPIAILMVGLFFVPRSPRWLVQKQRESEAETILTAIDGAENAQKEIHDIQQQLGEKCNWAELFNPGIRLALLIVVMLAIFQQWTGVSPSTFYAPTIFEMAGFTKEDAIKQLVFANIFNIICTATVMLIVDKLGRRKLYLWGVAGMGLGMILFGSAFYFHVSGRLLLMAYLFGFGAYLVSLAPLCWLIMSEVFPVRIRPKGMSLAAFVLWLSTLSSVYGLKYVLDWTEGVFGSPGPVFWGFAVICFLAWLFGYKLVPETKGKTLEEIGEGFLHK